MSKVIQRINISEENALFLTDFNPETNELSFRTTYDLRQLHTEIVAFVGPNVKTNLYFFDRRYLEKFIEANKN